MNRKLKEQLKKMGREDQSARASGSWDTGVGLKNAEKLKVIIEKYGWPDVDLVGKEASHLAWLVAQHADHDIKFQEKCLGLIKEKSKQKKVNSSEVAYLTDRIKVKKGEKQMYGTQFYLNKGKLLPFPVYDEKNLEKRRKKIGLENFKKYKKRLTGRQNKTNKK